MTDTIGSLTQSRGLPGPELGSVLLPARRFASSFSFRRNKCQAHPFHWLSFFFGVPPWRLLVAVYVIALLCFKVHQVAVYM